MYRHLLVVFYYYKSNSTMIVGNTITQRSADFFGGKFFFFLIYSVAILDFLTEGVSVLLLHSDLSQQAENSHKQMYFSILHHTIK